MTEYKTFKAPTNNYGVEKISYNELTRKITAFWDGETVKNSQNLKEMEEVNNFVVNSVLEHQKQEQHSKYDTLEELFFRKYDLNDIAENSYALWEAIGFLKGIKHLAPTWCPGSANKILKRLYEAQEYNANRNRDWLKEVFR